MKNQTSLFEDLRMGFDDAIELTAVSLRAYADRYRHWAIAFSGGKDSSTALTVTVWLIETGQVPKPESLTVFYADTRLEIMPLQICALKMLDNLKKRGIRTQVVLPELDDRLFVYMFGRGVPAPKNRFRWCTPMLKINPMLKALGALHAEVGEKFLMITGVRLGESAARDARIALSCSKDGAECGQGYFQEATPDSVADTLAPIVHWRVCFVWDWLFFFAPEHGFETQLVAEAYGGDEAQEINARTGCMACNLASKDVALETVTRNPAWAYLKPVGSLRDLYAELIKPQYRLRKNGERKKDGSLSSNPMRLGPYTMEARRLGLRTVLDIQRLINADALLFDRPLISLINEEEEARILQLINANTWPDKWTGKEQTGDVISDEIFSDGSCQPQLISANQHTTGTNYNDSI